MPERYVRQSALAHLGLGARARRDAGKPDPGVVLCERSGRGQLVLRGEGTEFLEAVRGAVGVAPPSTPNTAAGADDPAKGARILWLAPDEWLLTATRGSALAASEALRQPLAGRHAAVVDASDARAVIGLAGPSARDVLMKGCPIDVHARAFPAGACAGTSLARAQVVIDHLRADSEYPDFEVYVHRSFAEYLWAWLTDAGAEYGLKVVDG